MPIRPQNGSSVLSHLPATHFSASFFEEAAEKWTAEKPEFVPFCGLIGIRELSEIDSAQPLAKRSSQPFAVIREPLVGSHLREVGLLG